MADLLIRLGEVGQPGGVLTAARFLGVDSEEVCLAAAVCIDKLFSRLPVDQLVKFDRGYIHPGITKSSHTNAWGPFLLLDERLPAAPEARTAVLGLACLHGVGNARYDAVQRLIAVRDGSELPFLILRRINRIDPIHEAADAAVRERLTEAYLPHLVRCLPLIVRVDADPGILRSVVSMLARGRHDRTLREVIYSPDRSLRQSVVREGLELYGVAACSIVRHGLTSSDAQIRLACLRRIRSCLAGEPLREALRQLQRDASRRVRAEAFLTEAANFRDSAHLRWKHALLDRSGAIRRLARRRLETLNRLDVANIYRERLSSERDSIIALHGLAESGDVSDADLFRRFLIHPLLSRRRAAVRGLARVAGPHAKLELIRCLRDASRSVALEAADQLAVMLLEVELEQVYAVVQEDERPHAREAALRLIASTGIWSRLPWLIRAATHSNSATTQLAERLTSAAFASFRRLSEEPRHAGPARAALEESRAALCPNFEKQLVTWLAQPTPGPWRLSSHKNYQCPWVLVGLIEYDDTSSAADGSKRRPAESDAAAPFRDPRWVRCLGSGKGEWWTVSEDAAFFGALSRLWNATGIPPLYPPRGMPPDRSVELELHLRHEAMIGQNVQSWLTADEIEDSLGHHGIDIGQVSNEARILVMAMRELEARVGRGRVRLIFGFDVVPGPVRALLTEDGDCR